MEMRWKIRWEAPLWALLALALLPSGARGRQCKAPEIEHGRVDFIDLQFGATANFSCDEGYRLIGPTFAQCVIVGNVSDWSAKVPHCQVTCVSPELQNGRSNGVLALYGPGDVAVLQCEPGYILRGSSETRCQNDGSWDPPVPICERVTCVSPELENGRLNGALGPYGPGDVAVLQCKPGYTLRGSSEPRCQNDGSWDPPIPICERIGCGVPTRLSFAELKSEYRNQSYFPVGKTANYTCRPGYTRHPGIRPTITCLPNGTWSEPLEFCNRKSCGHPGELENGRINVTDLLFGSMVSFTCEEGHRLIGKSYIRCVISGSHVAWSGDMPFCERIPCYPPPDIPNGKHNGDLMDEFSYGSAVTYTCDNGYPPTGEASLLCTTEDGLNGVWRPTAPRCGGGCGVPTRLNFAELKSTYKNQSYFPVGQTIGYTCLPGYSIIPEMQTTITCLQNQMWSEALEFCKRKSCGHPGELENGEAVLTDTLFGSTVNFLCDEGHRLIGQPYRRCEIYGTHVEWSGGVPFCKPLMCPPPPATHYGKHDASSLAAFPSGTYVNYSCEPGYALGGEASIYCTTSGTWSHPSPLCEEPKTGYWKIIFVVLVLLLLLAVFVFVIRKCISKQKSGSYYTFANKNETTMIPMAAENT